jgi:ribosomal protein S18 acetylase RimI-like enzyme
MTLGAEGPYLFGEQSIAERTLARLSAYQGNRFSHTLCAVAEREAISLGLIACELNVDLDNPRALRLYERMGYRVIEIIPASAHERRAGLAGFQRMVKAM